MGALSTICQGVPGRGCQIGVVLACTVNPPKTLRLPDWHPDAGDAVATGGSERLLVIKVEEAGGPSSLPVSPTPRPTPSEMPRMTIVPATADRVRYLCLRYQGTRRIDAFSSS